MNKFFVRPLGFGVGQYSFVFEPKDELEMVAKCLLKNEVISVMSLKVEEEEPDFWHIIEGLIARVGLFTHQKPPDIDKVHLAWEEYYKDVILPAYKQSLNKNDKETLEEIMKDFPQRLARLTPHNKKLLQQTVGVITTVDEAIMCNNLLNDLLRVQQMDALLK